MKKLLCPIDFSEVSLNALEFAVAIGEKENSQITLLNIFTPDDFRKILNTDDVKEEYKKLLEIAESKLKAISEEIMILSNNRLAACSYLLKSGKVVDVLTEIAATEKFDMIVIGTTGHSALERKYLGAKARKIINEARCSVMVVPENATFHGIKKIVYATDYQEEDKLAIQQIIELAADLKASITVLHVSHHDDTIDKAMYEEFKAELEKFLHVSIIFLSTGWYFITYCRRPG
jgi:nucleotide-binding universal stress UspA family protein